MQSAGPVRVGSLTGGGVWTDTCKLEANGNITSVGTLKAPNIYTKTEVNGLLATKAGTSYVDASIAALLAQDPATLTSLVVNGCIGLANSAY